MRVLVLTDSHKIGANYILTHLPKNKDIKIVGIIEKKSGKWRFVKKLILISGLLLSIELLIFYIALKTIPLIKKIFFKRRKILTVEEIAKKYKIPFIKINNINSEESIAIIKALKPDLILSNHFIQILKRKILNIPVKGTINFHPGILPHYRGIFPYFWKLANKEKRGGVTIHFVTTAIDKGKVLASRTFKIKKIDTAIDVSVKSAKIGLGILNRTLRNIKAGRIRPRKIKIKGNYYSFPTKEGLKRFYENKKSLFSLSRLYDYF